MRWVRDVGIDKSGGGRDVVGHEHVARPRSTSGSAAWCSPCLARGSTWMVEEGVADVGCATEVRAERATVQLFSTSNLGTNQASERKRPSHRDVLFSSSPR